MKSIFFPLFFFSLLPPQSQLQGLQKVHTIGFLEVSLSSEIICPPVTHSLQWQSSVNSISLKRKSCSHCRKITSGEGGLKVHIDPTEWFEGLAVYFRFCHR